MREDLSPSRSSTRSGDVAGAVSEGATLSRHGSVNQDANGLNIVETNPGNSRGNSDTK